MGPAVKMDSHSFSAKDAMWLVWVMLDSEGRRMVVFVMRSSYPVVLPVLRIGSPAIAALQTRQICKHRLRRCNIVFELRERYVGGWMPVGASIPAKRRAEGRIPSSV